jgi:hypothetical protein
MRAIMHGKMGMQIDLLTLRVAAVSIWQSVQPFELFTNFFKFYQSSADVFKIKNTDLFWRNVIELYTIL